MSEDMSSAQRLLCSTIENNLRVSKDKIRRVSHIDGNDFRGRKIIGQELEEIQDELFHAMRHIDQIRTLYYETAGYDSIH
ncbi:hypothetical protein [Enterococcus faecalis]|uniref:hypothetical protein n=1 Tax=Enterococcus faecalis TaxID=1351 RepID=UPI001E458BA4|nr:hypothetical protein [Enterococcus faecalis]MCD4978461.1 hypothetical protein [Enterococcus faecalis]